MKLNIEIDEGSGFCFGVVKAIHKAEEVLQRDGTLYCLGDIVHNSREVERLRALGLRCVSHAEFARLHDTKVLLRAHGEPPETYAIARRNNIEIIDATCPVVLQLQKKIKAEHETGDTQIVIFGKRGHAEILGLVGQTDSKAIVIESIDDTEALTTDKPISLYSQTTQSIPAFKLVEERLSNRHRHAVTSHNTICRQVSGRIESIRAFAATHDIIIFVSDTKSSNGKVLFEECLAANPRSFRINGSQDIAALPITGTISTARIGICGATSTPKSQLEEVATTLQSLYSHDL